MNFFGSSHSEIHINIPGYGHIIAENWPRRLSFQSYTAITNRKARMMIAVGCQGLNISKVWDYASLQFLWPLALHYVRSYSG